MRKSIFCILSILSCFAAAPARANWEYSGTYLGDGWYDDDGSRFVISVRGGASMANASMKNKVGALTAHYWTDGFDYVSELYCGGRAGCIADGYTYLGYGSIGDLSVKKDFSEFAFAAGASLGWTLPGRPQWRFEAGWDHIMEMEYNQSPLFSGDLALIGGEEGSVVIQAESSGVQSKMVTDIIGVMAFYDFFKGMQKPVNKLIPYVGFGVGYANVKTTLDLTDLYGDLSADGGLFDFGEPIGDSDVLQFFRSEYDNSTIAAMGALGVSYGITQTMFFDLGVRVSYVPQVKWRLENEAGTRERDWFSADNLIYTNVMLGMRFEF